MARRSKREARLARKRRVRKRVRGTPGRPRLSVFRSSKHIYAQLIDDLSGRTLVAACSREKGFQERTQGADDAQSGNREGAAIVGCLLADRAKAEGVERVVFDRNGYLYHGRVKALADAVREGGVAF